MHHPCLFAHVQIDELATERMVEHNPQNLAKSFHRLSLNSHHSPTLALQVLFSTTEYTEHTESFLRRDNRVERVELSFGFSRVEHVETCRVLYWILDRVHHSYTANLIQKGLTLLQSTRSTHNRRLSGVRDSSEPRRANARAELKHFSCASCISWFKSLRPLRSP